MTQKLFGFVEWAGNNVDRDQFADAARGCGTGLRCGFNGTDIAANKHHDVAVEEVFLADENYIRGLDHCVCSLDSADETPRFNHTEGFHGVGT